MAQLPGPPRRLATRDCGVILYCCKQGDWLLVRAHPQPTFLSPDLPYRTSTSTSSRLARAVVNLVARPGESFIDPLCGTGVILVEAARIGCRVSGSDLNAKALWSARHNFEALGLSAEITKIDACDLAPDRADALVADLPYGRRLKPTDLEPLARSLPTLARRWALISHMDLEPLLSAIGHPPHTVIEVPKTTFVRRVLVGGEPLS
jgi:tRNA G10  N-methylase Trm11